MDIGIIIITHGQFAEALKQTLFSIVGQKEKVVSIPVSTEFTLETLCDKIKQEVKNLSSQYVVIFTDMLGGTPCNTSLIVCKEINNIYIISGVNLYMLITAVNLRETNISIDEYIDKIITEGKKCIVNVNNLFKNKFFKDK
jgi:mannose/fructose/sorbose-specific phosphotransferase system IIA component